MRFLLFISLFCYFFSSYGKGDDTIKRTNFYKEIRKYDLSALWLSDSLMNLEGENFKRPEPLGFIGDSFQRFYIHYISVSKNPKNPYLYDVKGKTKVKDKTSSFSGKIKIKEAYTIMMPLDKDQDEEVLKGKNVLQGWVTCEILFYEDKNQENTGLIIGKIETDFYFDTAGVLKYNALGTNDDSYSNNQAVATYESYKTGRRQKCNWGDFRIPEADSLDIGAGDFGPNPKYAKFGWEDYHPEILESGNSIPNMKEQWWK